MAFYNDFNTSHVTVYPYSPNTGTMTAHISIHLMLRFIDNAKLTKNGVTVFQYISCYGLSSDSTRSRISFIKFQYISCYGLSNMAEDRGMDIKEFQYISCYGLSDSF